MNVPSISKSELKYIKSMFDYDYTYADSLFMIGHSITGSLFKELSFVLNPFGVAFEASNSIGNAKYRLP